MNPAEELRAAAAKLREMAQGLGEWRYDEEWGFIRDGKRARPVAEVGRRDAAWIALMGPDKAALLADWLESSAKTTEAMLATWQRNPLELTDPHALALARSILVETR